MTEDRQLNKNIVAATPASPLGTLATQASRLQGLSAIVANRNMAPLVVENAVKKFRQGDRVVDALAGVSLEVQRGQFLAIMGASGSGKSTLLHLMAGLATPDEGRVLVNGTELKGMSDRELTLFRRRQIGLV